MIGSPNLLASLVLLLWPIVSLGFFLKWGPTRGLLATILGGYLLLPPPPAGFDLPLLPTLDKTSIPAYSSLAICLVLYRENLRLWPSGRLARGLLIGGFAGVLFTVLTNGDPVRWDQFVIPGQRMHDAIGMLLSRLVDLTPFLLSYSFLAKEEDQRTLLWAIVLATFAYSFPMLLEVRLSPQLNTWIYGFFQHSFEQMMRGGGFRPIVFLYHGLWVAFLLVMAIISTCVLLREGGSRQGVLILATIWLLGVLVLCKSMASLIYAVALVPVILFLPARFQIRLAAALVLLALTYPIARGADLLPVQRALEFFYEISPDRARSLQFRLDNEDVLLARAQERPFFGWGSWGRNLIHDGGGRILSIPDGRWIVIMGSLGWTGYLSEFGLLALPVLLIWWRGGPAAPHLTIGLLLMLAVNMVDLLPNATVTPITWLLAGSLLAWAERPREATAQPTVQSRKQGLPVLLGAQAPSRIKTVL